MPPLLLEPPLSELSTLNGQDQKGMNRDNTQNLSRQKSRDLSRASDRFLAACQDSGFQFRGNTRAFPKTQNFVDISKLE